jgi:hypothetical protein
VWDQSSVGVASIMAVCREREREGREREGESVEKEIEREES